MAYLPPLDFTVLDSPPALELEDFRNNGNFSHVKEKVQVGMPGLSLKVYIEQVVKSDIDPPERSVLFLHGMRFSSKNWADIQSIFHVANWGWRAVAIDLPGYGQTTDSLGAENPRAEFLSALITKLDLKKPVIISPSMSGSFSLPFLFGDGVESTDLATGYVPVAPVMTEQFVKSYPQSQLPTLIVSGTNDNILGQASNQYLGHLAKGQYAPIEGAGHACYLDNPDAFHKYLYHFLQHF